MRVRVPGEWQCPVCTYKLHKRVLHQADGAVSIDKSQERERCPNDGLYLIPVEENEA